MDIPDDMAECYVYIVLMSRDDGTVLSMPATPPTRPAGVLAFMTPEIALGLASTLGVAGVVRAKLKEAIRLAHDHDLALYLLDHTEGKYHELTGRTDCMGQPEPLAPITGKPAMEIRIALSRPTGYG